MATIPLALDGYTDLPTGLLANVVTHLETTAPPPVAARPHPPVAEIGRAHV